jgi:hypothetical protein
MAFTPQSLATATTAAGFAAEAAARIPLEELLHICLLHDEGLAAKHQDGLCLISRILDLAKHCTQT